jgi:N-acetylmuramoyl-L-alanine amidase
MDPVAIAGLCALLAHGQMAGPAHQGVTCPIAATLSEAARPVLDGQALAARLAAPGAREAIARVAFAEAGNQGDSGLAGVVYIILNRLADGRWGPSVEAVIGAPGQFEPVSRVGGDWRALPAPNAAGQARIDTILNLAVEGRLPDLTRGARYFQNPAIVAARTRAGTARPALVNFGGQAPTVIIGTHSFFAGEGRGGGAGVPPARRPAAAPDAGVFVGENQTMSVTDPPNSGVGDADQKGPRPAPPGGDPGRALFVTRDGSVRADPP